MDWISSFLIGILVNLITKAGEYLKENIFLKKAGQVVSREIKKGVIRALLSALQKIVLDCHKELYPHKFLGVLPIYPAKHRDVLKWLDQKRDQLAKQLDILERDNKSVDLPFLSVDNNNSLFHLTDFSATNIQLVKEQLIAEVLKNDDVPDCYKRKVNSDLFVQVCEHFEWEINYNPQVNNFIINAELTPLIAPKNDATITLQLDVELNKLSTPQLSAIIEELQQHGMGVTLNIRRIEEGSVKLVLEGSQQGIKRIEELFKSGQLTEVSGIPIKNVRVTTPMTPTVRLIAQELEQLKEWFAGLFQGNWQPAELVLASAYRGTEDKVPDGSVKRAKVINLAEQSVALVVQLTPEEGENVAVSLQVYPAGGANYLPIGLQVMVLDESGNIFMEDKTDADADYDSMELPWIRERGEQYAIKLTLGDFSITENL
jgi:hypothetical protein